MKQLYRITDTLEFGMFSGSDKSIQRLFILKALYSLETYNHESIIVTNVKQNDGQWSANFKLDEKKETHILSDKIRDINKLKFDNIYN